MSEIEEEMTPRRGSNQRLLDYKSDVHLDRTGYLFSNKNVQNLAFSCRKNKHYWYRIVIGTLHEYDFNTVKTGG